MPLRQSRLSFGQRGAKNDASLLDSTSVAKSSAMVKVSGDSNVDVDTIVVDLSERNPQLPTPSESATDVSSQSSTAESSSKLSKPKSRRVSTSRKSKFTEATMDGNNSTKAEKNRSVSGETLVNKASQSTLLKEGIEALDLQWDMSRVLDHAAKDQMARESSQDKDEIESSSSVQQEDSEDEAERAAKAAARKQKMEDKAKMWEERRLLANKNAVRKSKRASTVIEKASEVLSGLASTVLGKRGREVASQSSQKDQENTVSVGHQEPATKKSKVTHDNKPLPPLPRKSLHARDKKWLMSGLYAGQARTFDARLTESSNNKKTKSKQDVQPIKENSVLPLPMFAGERLLKQGRDFKLPFDIYSPVPQGQAKPENWRKQNRNVIVGEANDYWRSDWYKESSKCICDPDIGCDQDCLNRTMYYECDDTNCNAPEWRCRNRQWLELSKRVKMNLSYSIGVDVIKTADRGHGVRANRTFAPNQIILEYTGEIVTQEECERRMRTDYKHNECYYLMLFDQNMILDATKGSMARFVNHSCEPNCRMEKWTVRGAPRMALFAGERGIMTGEELTYDYNFDPYSQKNVQQCRCGAKTCRGFLGPRPKDVKQKSPDTDESVKKPEGKLAGAKRKVAVILEESTSKLNKKRKTESKEDGKSAPKSKSVKVSSPGKVIAVKKLGKKKVSVLKSISKSSTKTIALKKIISGSKPKKMNQKDKRIASSSSTKPLISKAVGKKATQGVSKSSSIKKKATDLKNNVVNSVRGRRK